MLGTRIPAVEMAAAALYPLSEGQRIEFAISLLRDINDVSSARGLIRLGRAATDQGNELSDRIFKRECI